VVSPWSEVDEQVAAATVRAVHAHCPSIDGARCAVIAPSANLAVTYSMLRQIELCGGTAVLVEPHHPESVCQTLVDQGVEVVFTLPLVASRIAESSSAVRRGCLAGIRLLFCGGDVLSPARHAMLARCWDAFVINLFGCSELFGPVAGPSGQGQDLTWRCESVAVEVIDPVTLQPCGQGQRGVMVLTSLWPKASPLLRYWTDDVVTVIDGTNSADRFVFEFVGRPPSILSFQNRQVPLRDLDNALLSSGWCASEWSLRETSTGLRIEVEMPRRKPAMLHGVRELLHEVVGGPIELVPHELGSLPREVPKFTVGGRPAGR
jgi:phenylacetate-CoA ligase